MILVQQLVVQTVKSHEQGRITGLEVDIPDITLFHIRLQIFGQT